MRCPKCDQQFEEGSRRFCPTDGSRLMPEGGSAPATGGIFTNILQRSGVETGAINDIGSNLPTESIAEPPVIAETLEMTTAPKTANSDIFFELDDDLELELGDPTPTVLEPVEPVPAKPISFEESVRNFDAASIRDLSSFRKVEPTEIPKGHIDLTSTTRSSAFPEVDPAAPEKFIGRIVKGRYQVTEFIGGGYDTGFAFIGEDRLGGDRKVLVKVFEAADPGDMVAALIAEERIVLSHFTHPNIARLIDSGEFASGQTFLINEYYDSLSVEESLSINGKLDPQRAARVVRQAGNALTEAHREGILHRDIRPGNMILEHTDDGEMLKLVNFGVSNGSPTDHSVYYRAPEVIAGRIGTAASDTYSLAVSAYEMLVGDVPFVGDTVRDFQRAQTRGIDQDHLVANFGLSAATADVIAKGLAIEPAERYPRARDLGDALAESVKQSNEATNVVTAPVAATAVDAEMERAFTAGEDDDVIVEQSDQSAAPKTVVLEPAWKNRSPEPPTENTSRWMTFGLLGLGALLIALIAGWYYLYSNRPTQELVADETQVANAGMPTEMSPLSADIEVPPNEQPIPQPPNTFFYENSKQNLKGDLARNFVGFKLYYPKDWKVNGPQSSTNANSRGKFLDIARNDSEGRMREQMLISYYPSRGTYKDDADRFPELVKETNETLAKLLPDYQMVGEGETRFNGEWKAYEVKFQGGGTTPSGQKMMVWGKRIFIPAARPGTRNGFEITLIASSLAEGIASADDVGAKGELAAILSTFQPGRNF